MPKLGLIARPDVSRPEIRCFTHGVSIRQGTDVAWDWGSGEATGTVTAVHHETVRRTIKGSEIIRHGSAEDPAYEIEQDDGSRVLKLASEVRRS